MLQILPGNRLHFLLRLVFSHFMKYLAFSIKSGVSLLYESCFLLHMCACMSIMLQASFVVESWSVICVLQLFNVHQYW